MFKYNGWRGRGEGRKDIERRRRRRRRRRKGELHERTGRRDPQKEGGNEGGKEIIGDKEMKVN